MERKHPHDQADEESQFFLEEMKHPFVLLVDDDEDQLLLFKIVLERVDCEVVTASSAKAALEILKEIHIDLVVCDVNMPQMDGREFIWRMRRASSLSKLPIIAFSAASKYTQDELLRCGADFFCSKTETKSLLNHVGELVHKQDANQSLLKQIRQRFGH